METWSACGRQRRRKQPFLETGYIYRQAGQNVTGQIGLRRDGRAEYRENPWTTAPVRRPEGFPWGAQEGALFIPVVVVKVFPLRRSQGDAVKTLPSYSNVVEL